MWANGVAGECARLHAVACCIVVASLFLGPGLVAGSPQAPPDPSATPPTVLCIAPTMGSSSVALNADIVIWFSTAMNQAYVQAAFSIYPAVAGTFSWNAGGDIMTFNPSSDFPMGTEYVVALDGNIAKDATGTYLDGDVDGTHETGGSWSAMTSCPSSYYSRAQAVIGDDIYLVGGRYGTSTPTGAVSIYHTATNSWGSASPMDVPRSGLTANEVDGKIYAMGGWNPDTTMTYDTVEAYDPALDDWTTLSPMPVARRGACSAAYGGKIYVFGGYGATTRTDIYDVAAGTWSVGATIPQGLGYAGASLVGDRIYVNGGAYSTRTQIYDISDNAWTTGADMLTPRMSHDSATVGGYVYSIGGSDYYAGTVCDDCEMYAPGTNAWTAMAPMPTARWDLSLAAVEGRIFAIDGSQAMTQNERFTPSDEFRSSFRTTSTPPRPSMALGKWAPFGVARGEFMTYLLNYTNPGPGIAYDVVVQETYPSGLTFVTANPFPSVGSSTWNLGTVPAGASGTIAVTLLVDGGAFGALVNTATLACDDSTGSPMNLVSASATTYVFDVAQVVNANTKEGFTTIQASINDADTLDGHTLLVSDGTYNEHVTVTKMLTVIGESAAGTVVNGGGFGDVVKVTANNVRISRITAKGSGSDTMNKDAGIKLLNNAGCVVEECILRDNNLIGLDIKRTDYASTGHLIDDCNFSHNQYGVYCEAATGNVVSNSFFFDNSRGLYQCVNGYTVYGNTFYWNSFGILYSAADNNIVRDNSFQANYYGIWMDNLCSGNVVHHNEFSDNTVQAYDTGANVWDDGYPSGGNAWSDHVNDDGFTGAGQDVPGQDGIVDVEYVIDGDSVDRYPLVRSIAPPTASIALAPGWNLVSIPTDEADWSLAAVLAPIAGEYDLVQAYDSTDGRWNSYSISAPAWMNTLEELSPSCGYWIRVTSGSPVSLPLYGTERATAVDILLLKGWNLAGYPSSATGVTVGGSLAGTQWDSVQAFDGSQPYNLRSAPGTDALVPGAGYWIHVTDDCVWSVQP